MLRISSDQYHCFRAESSIHVQRLNLYNPAYFPSPVQLQKLVCSFVFLIEMMIQVFYLSFVSWIGFLFPDLKKPKPISLT